MEVGRRKQTTGKGYKNMNHVSQQTNVRMAASQPPFIIFEHEKKPETEKAEKQMTDQERRQRKIEENIKRRKETSRDKSQHKPA